MRNKSYSARTIVIVVFSLTCLFFSQSFADDNVLIGINTPLSGAYALQGEDQLKAYIMAIKKLNEQGGLLGRGIDYLVEDTQTNANTARSKARFFINSNAVMVTGGSSSSVAIAQCEECQNSGTLFMAGLTHSNATTGRDGHRHCFRWYNNGHQTAKAMSQTLIKKFGNDARYAYLYADYTWGQTVQKSMQDVVEQQGGKTVEKMPVKLGEKNFVSYLFKARKAKPDVFVLVLFGADMVNCLKQVTMLKFREEMAIVVPLMELHMAHSVGPEVMQGVITSMPWYHGLSERYDGSREFVEEFEREWEKKPGNAAAVAWVNIFQYADAVKRAKSFDPKKIIRELEGHRFTLLTDEEYWRSWDHQGIHPTYVAVGKTPDESKNEWDLFKIIETHPGNSIARTREENPVQLEQLE